VDGREETGGRNDVAGGSLHRLDDDGRDLRRALVADDVARLLRAGQAAVRVGQLERAAVAVRVWRRIAAGGERPEPLLEIAPEKRQDPAGRPVVGAVGAGDM